MQLSSTDTGLRAFALFIVYLTTLFLINNFLTFWWDWPGALATLKSVDDNAKLLGWVQVASYLSLPILTWLHVQSRSQDTYFAWSQRMSDWAAYSIHVAFWLVMLVGIGDALVAFLRVESMLSTFLPAQIVADLGRPIYRGNILHLPLALLAFLVAWRSKGLGFIWLTLLVVIAEFMIVITRFIFSYEQAFMGDLVRFWYAALFLFASAHTLLVEGHIRVDVAYTHFSDRSKAWVNSVGVLMLGIPLCWTILFLGMWDRTSSINSPLLSMEVSQSGYGMYVKYLMVGFLAIFAYSMIIQFASYLMKHIGVLRGESPPDSQAQDSLPKLGSETTFDPSHPTISPPSARTQFKTPQS